MYSVTAGSAVKLLLNNPLSFPLHPIHTVINLTNKCNLNCEFCVYKGCDRTQELEWVTLINYLEDFAYLGGRAVTFSGGGEPLLDPLINDAVRYARRLHLKVGLVTNGVFLGNLQDSALESLSWIRVSVNIFTNEYLLELVKKRKCSVRPSWSLSYVLRGKDDIKNVDRLLWIASKNDFTHVRVTQDMNRQIKFTPPKHPKLFYQQRNDYQHGAETCYCSIIKPVLFADGYIYPCCTWNHSVENRLGKAEELTRLVKEQRFFKGSSCERCLLYSQNSVLEMLRRGQVDDCFV